MKIKLLAAGIFAALALASSPAAKADLPSYGDIVYTQTRGQVILPSDAWKGQQALFNSVSEFGTLVNAAPEVNNGLYGGVGQTTQVKAKKLSAKSASYPDDHDIAAAYPNGSLTSSVLVFNQNTIDPLGTQKTFTMSGAFGFCVANPDTSFIDGSGQSVMLTPFTWYTQSLLNADGGDHYKIYHVTGEGAYRKNLFFGLEDQSFTANSDRDFNDYVFTASFQPVPEPAFFQLGALLLAGGFVLYRMRRRKPSTDA